MFFIIRAQCLSECGNHDPTIYCLTRYFDYTDLGSDSGAIIFAYSLLILILLYIPLLKTRISRSFQRFKMRLRQLEAFGIIVPLLDTTKAVFGRVFKKVYTRSLIDRVIWRPDAPRWVIKLKELSEAGTLKVRNDWQAIAVQIFYLAAWAFYFFCFSVFMKDLRLFLDQGMINFDWSFGQIVGITVWAEPLVEYAYLEISECPAMYFFFLPPNNC